MGAQDICIFLKLHVNYNDLKKKDLIINNL